MVMIMMMMRAGISGRRWGGALRTSVSTKSTASTPLLCLLSPTTTYYTAYYPLHIIVSVPHAAASMNTTTWALITTRGVDTSDQFNFTVHRSYSLWCSFDFVLTSTTYNVDLIKCMFTNKIKISFSPSWHIPKRFNAWKILLDASTKTEGMHSNTIQCNAIQIQIQCNTNTNTIQCISEDRGNA